MQAGLLVLHVWGHWIDPVYSPNHVTGEFASHASFETSKHFVAFMVAGFWLSFHISTFYRFQKAFQSEVRASAF